MTRRFDPKLFQGKDRVYVPVAGAEGVLRLYRWDEAKREYRPPNGSKSYLARRWETDPNTGIRARRTQYFESLADARAWRTRASENPATPAENPPVISGPTFSAVVAEWKSRRFHALAQTTTTAYEKLLRLYFSPLMEMPIRAVTPQVIDQWIAGLLASRDKYGRGDSRKAFQHELRLLSVILRHYAEYSDDPTFVMPLKKRHREAVRLRNRLKTVPKDLTELEFRRFLVELEKAPDGRQLAALATVQFYQALRISEVAALHWDNARFDFDDPRRSRLTISRHVAYARSRDVADRIESGFKNSDGQGGTKEHPMMPAVFVALAKLYRPGAVGLVFVSPRTRQFYDYRTLQHRYDQAFKRAGLPYRGTHVLRHGGTRKTFDDTRGDIGVAQQVLGNRDRKTVDVYARRASGALTAYAEAQWEQANAFLGGRNWSQETAELKLVRGN